MTKLVGHSLGGSVCVRTVPLLLERKYRITGVAVLDVVEGAPVQDQRIPSIRPAMFVHRVNWPLLLEFTLDALPHMHALLHTRPIGFGSIEEGIEWQ